MSKEKTGQKVKVEDLKKGDILHYELASIIEYIIKNEEWQECYIGIRDCNGYPDRLERTYGTEFTVLDWSLDDWDAFRAL